MVFTEKTLPRGVSFIDASGLVFAILTGITVVGVTLLADRLGGRIGGLLATAPVTTSAAHVIIATSVAPSQAAARILGGGSALIASTLGIVIFFYVVKLTRKHASNTRLALGLAAYLVTFLPLTVLIARTGAPPSLTFPVLFGSHAALALTFMRVPVPISAVGQPKPRTRRTVREMTSRFFAGAVVVLVIEFLVEAAPVLAGALAVVPAVFLVSLTVMGVRQNAPFAAKAAQAGLFGTTAVAVFVLVIAAVLAVQPPGGVWVAMPPAWAAYGATLLLLGKVHGRLLAEPARADA